MFATQDAAQARFDVCKTCPSLRRPAFNCGECGCFMKVKVKFQNSSCPLGKW